MVHGFPSKVTALMFEHAWQHAFKTRHIKREQRIVSTQAGGRSLHHKLGSVRLLIMSQFFSRMQLKVHCFTTECYNVWCENKFGVTMSAYVQVHHIQESKRDEELNMEHIVAFKKGYQEQDKKQLDKYGELLIFGESECKGCHGIVDYANGNDFPLLGLCDRCDSRCHLLCLAKEHSSNDLIPQRASCPGCGATSSWPALVRRATRVRARYALNII